MCSELSLRIDPDAQVDVPLRDLAYQTVRRAIQLGYFRPGQHLSEHGLTRELGISRTPIRDALRKLEADRWLERKRNGLVVASLSADEIAELFGVRSALETYAVRLAAGRARASEIAELRQISQDFRAAYQDQRAAEVVQINVAFHWRLATMAGNQLLCQMIDELAQRMRLLTALVMSDPDLVVRSADEHDGIIDAVERGNADDAEQRVRDHLCRLQQLYAVRTARLSTIGRSSPLANSALAHRAEGR